MLVQSWVSYSIGNYVLAVLCVGHTKVLLVSGKCSNIVVLVLLGANPCPRPFIHNDVCIPDIIQEEATLITCFASPVLILAVKVLSGLVQALP